MRRFALLLSLFIFPSIAAGQTPKEKLIPIVELGAHTRPLLDTFFSADGKQLISVSLDRSVRFWDLASREQLRVLHMPQGVGADGEFTASALSADGKLLAVASYWLRQGQDRQARVYVLDVNTGSIQQVLEGLREPIRQVLISSDGKWVAATSDNEPDIHLWKIGRGKFQRILEGGSSSYQKFIAFSPDGTSLAVAHGPMLRLWNLETGEIKQEIQDAKKPIITRLAWSPDGKTLATAHADGLRLRSSDLSLRQHAERFVSCRDVFFSPDSSRMAVLWGKTPYYTSVVDLASGKDISKPQQGNLTGSFAPDGSMMALFSRGKSFTVYLCQVKDGQAEPWGGLARILPDPQSTGLGWNKEGNALGYAKTWSFDFGGLRFGPVPMKEELLGPLQKQGSLAFETFPGGAFRIVQENKPLVALTAPPGDRWYGSNARTFLGKDRVVLGTTKGDLHLFQLPEGKHLRHCQAHNGFASWVAPNPHSPYVISAGYSPTFCLWNPEQDKPLLNLVVVRASTKPKDEGEWLAWTPEGFYACSAATEQKLGFLIDKGPDKMPAFVPASKFRKVLYRPDVLKRLLEFGSVEKALEAANKASGVKTTFRSAADLVPATVVLALPVKQGATVRQPQLKVEAKVTKPGSQPVLKLQLLLDGRPYQGDKSLVAHVKDQPAFWNVDLPPGSHRLAVIAHTAVSSSRSDDMEITYAPATPPDPKSLLPTLYLVSIGINAYPGDWKLSCAVNDATKLADTFHKKSKPPFRDIQHRLLTDKQATKKGILAELTWLKKQMKPQDIAVIFYAGHGTRDDQGHFYLLPVDFDLKALKKTAVSGEELKKRFADLPGRVLVMLDACHSGAIGARNKGGVTDELTRELTDDDCGVVMLCAAMGREEAGEERKLGHGYFALALIKGLSGEAGVSKRDGFVYLHHLHNYVIEAVQELSNDEQHPVLGMPTTVRSFALAKPK